jgi:hypothetical protein
VQHDIAVASPFHSAGTSLALELATPIAAGDVVAVFASYDSLGTAPVISDDAGDSFVMVQSVSDLVDSQDAAAAYAVTTGAATTITLTQPIAACCQILVVEELRGVDPQAPLDAHIGSAQATVTAVIDGATTGPTSTSVAGDYVFAASVLAANRPLQSIAAGTGFTTVDARTQSSLGGNAVTSESATLSVAGPLAATFTYSIATTNALSLALAFRPAP